MGKSPSIIITCSGVEIPGHKQRVHDNEEVEGNGLLSGQSQESFSGEMQRQGRKENRMIITIQESEHRKERWLASFFFFFKPSFKS